ncbi:MAG: MarR family transcriptional regulator [Ilumatobacter sp.]|nr:MarR family transcriptional regulator [Ilumatobacter sp.]
MGTARDPIELARDNWRSAGWADSSDGMALVTSVMRVQQVLLTTIDDLLRPFGLTFARFEVLMLLHFSRVGELPVGKIGERLQVHPASVTNAVNRLEGAGHVTRRPNADDGRSVLAAITAQGRALVLDAAATLNAEVFLNVPLPAAARHDLYELMRRWRSEFEDFDE